MGDFGGADPGGGFAPLGGEGALLGAPMLGDCGGAGGAQMPNLSDFASLPTGMGMLDGMPENSLPPGMGDLGGPMGMAAPMPGMACAGAGSFGNAAPGPSSALAAMAEKMQADLRRLETVESAQMQAQRREAEAQAMREQQRIMEMQLAAEEAHAGARELPAHMQIRGG